LSRSWYDGSTQIERQRRYYHARNHVRSHQSLKRNASRKHRDDFGIGGEIGREKDDRDEHKQRAEQVGEVRHEVNIVVKDNRFQRSVVLSELRQVLIDIKHDGDRDDKGYRIEVGANEFLYYIDVETFEIAARIEEFQKAENAFQPRHQPHKPRQTLLHTPPKA